MRILFVSGRFNDDGGRPSGYAAKLFQSLRKQFGDSDGHQHFNGGFYDELVKLTDSDTLKTADIIFWMPDVPNDKVKVVSDLKKINPTCMLVISKNNLDDKYQSIDLVSRALAAKANLLIEFTRDGQRFAASIIDPLGNRFLNQEADIDVIAAALSRRLVQLADFTRIGSRSSSEEAPALPEVDGFIERVRGFADKFHLLIHGVNTSRFLGNASFRCENGFPSMRADGLIYVTQRNLDKRDLGPQGFIPVELCEAGCQESVTYFGERKPSVDTPIQRELYAYYKNVNFMVHSHVYVEGAPFTTEKIPCGAYEEALAIQKLLPWPGMSGSFAVNLLGHGSVIFAEKVEDFDQWEFVARQMPEDAL